MSSKRALATALARLEGFESPRVDLEQYPTPADLAATVVHLADLNDDLDRPVVDLGCGTGVLAIGAARRGAAPAVGLDVDPAAIGTARRNAASLGVAGATDWVRADATRAPIPDRRDATVLMNPPFGAQDGNEHADRGFLRTAARIATVSYSVHNAGSVEFIEAFTPDNGGRITQAYTAELSLDRRFGFHDADERLIDAEVYRIEWDGHS